MLTVTVASLAVLAPVAIAKPAPPPAVPDEPAMRLQGSRRSTPTFNLGAVFADRAPDASASSDCVQAASWALFDRGTLELTLATPGLQAAPPVTFTSRKAVDGAAEHVVTRGRCRDVLSMRTETRQGDGWTAAGNEGGARPELSPTAAAEEQDVAATNERNRRALAAMKTAAFGAKGDIDVSTLSFWLGSVAEACPQTSGMAVFAQHAVYLHLPWDGHGAMVPSLSRGADGTTAHLMLEWPACRVDLRVSRDLLVGDRWQPAPLVPPP